MRRVSSSRVACEWPLAGALFVSVLCAAAAGGVDDDDEDDDGVDDGVEENC